MWEAERGGQKHEWEGAVFPRAQGKLKVLLTTYSQNAPILGIPAELLHNNLYIALVYMLKIRSFPSSSFNPVTKKYFHLHL